MSTFDQFRDMEKICWDYGEGCLPSNALLKYWAKQNDIKLRDCTMYGETFAILSTPDVDALCEWIETSRGQLDQGVDVFAGAR